jgi:tRNA pseudouridine55 synthase
MYNGILNLNKPRGWTSHDVVAWVRRLLDVSPGRRHGEAPGQGRTTTRVGHAGTLDPLATGVLLVCVGHATRVAEYLMASEKVYRGAAELGMTTDTYDIEGEITRTAQVPRLDRQDLELALRSFTGRIQQIPPPYSAIKQGGVPAYRKARRGESVELAPRRVVIHSLALQEWRSPHLVIELVCDPGTYVRSLVHDLGEMLGCGAVLTGLTRLRSGSFTLEDAISLDDLTSAARGGQVARHLQPLETALAALARVPVDGSTKDRLLSGQPVSGPNAAADRLGYAIDPDGTVLAILAYDVSASLWRPRKVFLPGEPSPS